MSKSRDMKVLELLEKHKYCTTGQVAEVLFSNIKNPKWRKQKATNRCKVLFNNKLINRMRIPGQNYIYTVRDPRYNHLVNHYLVIVDIWMALEKIKPSGSVLRHEVEIKLDDLVCDLWVEHINNFRGVKQEYFVEVELASSGDIVEKIKRYEALAWRRKVDNLDCKLIIVYENQRTKRNIDVYKTGLDLKAIFIEDFAKEWKW